MIGQMKQLERALLERDSQINQLRLENEQLQEKLQNIQDEDLKFKVCVEQEQEIESLKRCLDAAASYIDILGGDHKRYLKMLTTEENQE